MLNCWTVGGPTIKTILIFPEFISTQQKTSLFYEFLCEIKPVLESCDQGGITIYDHAHPNIFQSTFNFNEFVTTRKNQAFSSFYSKDIPDLKILQLIGQKHFGPCIRNQNFPKYEICPRIQ